MISNSSEQRRSADQAFQDSLNQLEAFLMESVSAESVSENAAIAIQDSEPIPTPDQAVAQWEVAGADLEEFLELDVEE